MKLYHSENTKINIMNKKQSQNIISALILEACTLVPVGLRI